MIENSPSDDQIKKQFADYRPAVPAHIWENISKENNKKRPFAFWYNFFGSKTTPLVLTILVAVFAGIFINRSTHIVGANTSVHQANPSQYHTSALVINNRTKQSSKLLNEEKTTARLTPADLSPGLPVNDKPCNTAKVNTAATGKTRIRYKMSQPVTSLEQPLHNVNRKTNKTKNRLAINYIAGELGSQNTEHQNTAAGTVEESEAGDLSLNHVLLNPGIIHSMATLPLNINTLDVPFAGIPCPESEKDAAGNKRYIELYAGPDFTFRSIKDTGNSVYAQKRNESSRIISAFSVGLRYTKVFYNGMSFRTGLNYSQINEKFSFVQGNTIQVTYIVNNTGDTTGSYTTTGTHYKTTINRFRTIDLPIMIGYELGNGKFHLNFNAGPIVNLYSWQKGDVLDTAYQPIEITTGKTSSRYQFRTNIGVGFMGAVSVYYKLNSRIHLFAEPYFRYNLSAASKAELTLKQKYNTAGVRLGVRMDF